MSIFKKIYYKYVLKPKSHLDFCNLCCSWNPWHHPYTIHAAWCPRFQGEYHSLPENKKSWGDFYKVGMPKDNIWDELSKLYRK